MTFNFPEVNRILMMEHNVDISLDEFTSTIHTRNQAKEFCQSNRKYTKIIRLEWYYPDMRFFTCEYVFLVGAGAKKVNFNLTL